MRAQQMVVRKVIKTSSVAAMSVYPLEAGYLIIDEVSFLVGSILGR